MAGSAYRVMRVLPADQHDQRHCSGCYREQDDQAGGLSPAGSGRPSDLGNQAPEGASRFFHCRLLDGQRNGALPSAAYKLCGSQERLIRQVEVSNCRAYVRLTVARRALGRHQLTMLDLR